MNHRHAEIPKRRVPRVVVTLCVLCLGGSTAFGTTDNWPRRYNHGVTAYQSNDFSRAAAMFENATASQDRALQQRSLYNLGNTEYRLGQARPAQAQQLWERALKNYESALALDPKDADAKFNHDFVKKKLEELKQQRQQQQQNQKDQQDKKQEQKKNEQEQKQDQQQRNSKDEQSEQQKQQQSQEQQKQDQEQKHKQQERQAQQQKSSPPEQKPTEPGGEPEDYDKRQATALLNDLRENERNWNFFPEVQMKDLKDSGKPAKDW